MRRLKPGIIRHGLSTASVAFVWCSAAAQQPPATGTSPERDPKLTQNIDPVTGRPINRNGSPGDIVDKAVADRFKTAGPDRNGRITGAVAPFIALPASHDVQQQSPPVRGLDRALSQRDLPGDTVKERRRPGYDPRGLTIGTIKVQPYISARAGYDSNVYAETNGRADMVYLAEGGFRALSDWGRHALLLSANVRRRENDRFSSENVWTYRIDGTGRYDLQGRNSILLHGLAERAVIDRNVVDSVVSQAFPTIIRNSLGELTGHIEHGPLVVDATVSLARQVVEDNRTLTGAVLDQRTRNYDGVGGQLSVGFDIGALRSIYGLVDVEARRFDVQANNVDRDANIYKVITGLRGGITRLIRGNVGLGYMYVDFKQGGAKPLKALALDAKLDWLVTEQTTVSLRAQRDLRTVAEANVRGAIVTSTVLSVDHEAWRNLILSVTAQQQWSKYIGDTRRARASGLGVAGTWMADRHLRLKPELSYLRRTDLGFQLNASPTDVIASITVSYQF